jgi:MYXO-CTERM domain-containing protein
MSLGLGFSSLAAALMLSSTASAHISLERGGTHKSRYGDGELKGPPCGRAGGTRGSNIYTYEPGQTITVKWVEFIPHPGYFRFAFDQDGDDDFKDPQSITPLDPNRGCPASNLGDDNKPRDECMNDDFYNSPSVLPGLDNLYPHVMAPAGMEYSQEVKLPDVECDNCTLQLIQVMEDPVHGPYNTTVGPTNDLEDVYHTCIDLVLKKGAAASGGSGADDNAEADAGVAGRASGAAGGSAGADSSAAAGSPAASGSSSAAGSSAAAGHGGGSAAEAGSSAPASDSDDGGCTVAHRPRSPLTAAWALPVLGMLLLRRARRRKRC